MSELPASFGLVKRSLWARRVAVGATSLGGAAQEGKKGTRERDERRRGVRVQGWGRASAHPSWQCGSFVSLARPKGLSLQPKHRSETNQVPGLLRPALGFLGASRW